MRAITTPVPEATDDQIRGLMTDAGEAGDRAMVAICRLALGLPLETEGTGGIATDDIHAHVAARFPDAPRARAECARVLAEGEEAREDEFKRLDAEYKRAFYTPEQPDPNDPEGFRK